MKMNSVDLSGFEEDLILFEQEYEDALKDMVAELGPRDDIEELFAPCREAVLSYYPTLDFCYRQHGYYHKYDKHIQPQSALLGRKVAGVMWALIDKYSERLEEERKVVDFDELPPVPLGARFFAVSEVRKHIEPKVSTASRSAARSEVLAEAMKEMEPGTDRTWSYAERKYAKRDQSLLKTAARMAGWYDTLKEGWRPYRSFIHSYKGYPALTVVYLETPRKEKQHNK
jgi:hypothetical protein